MEISVDEPQNQDKLKDILPLYYKRLFPFEQLYKWLSYGGDNKYLSRREFSLTKDEIFTRFQSFDTMETFKREIIKKCPDKMDIGAVYNIKPSGAGSVSNFVPTEKELVFDIDATDYNEVLIEKEEGGGLIGSTTWPLMAIAVKVLDDILREDFGFKHILWVFSGRRGVHAWVCDKRARLLSTFGRSAIAEFLQVISGGNQKVHKANLKTTLHPSLQRVYDKYLKPKFTKVLVEEQNLFCNPNHTEHILSFLPEELKTRFRNHWYEKPETSSQRWIDFEATVKKHIEREKMKSNPIQDLVFTYTYPRLDINVSKQMHHLLKSPMVIHPSTGCVCVPIDIKKVFKFKPEEVPTIHSLLREIDCFKNEEEGGSVVSDHGKTSLGSYIEIFDKFLDSLPKEEGVEKRD